MRTLEFGFTASAKEITFRFVMTNPLSNIRGSLKDIKADYARHAGIKLQGGNYDICWRNLCDSIGQPAATKSAALLYKVREATYIMGQSGTSKSLAEAMLNSDITKFSKSVNAPKASAVKKTKPQPKPERSSPKASVGSASSATQILRKNKPVTISNQWLEKDLEDFLVKHWDDIDLNVPEGKLELIGRQKRLGQSRDHVDLLALSLTGVYVAIELKIKRAGGSELTQLQSYIQDMRDSEREKFVGVLVAPEFSPKVENVARGVDEVRLRTFKLRAK